MLCNSCRSASTCFHFVFTHFSVCDIMAAVCVAAKPLLKCGRLTRPHVKRWALRLSLSIEGWWARTPRTPLNCHTLFWPKKQTTQTLLAYVNILHGRALAGKLMVVILWQKRRFRFWIKNETETPFSPYADRIDLLSNNNYLVKWILDNP